jgi:uncharacterized Zn-finger protein
LGSKNPSFSSSGKIEQGQLAVNLRTVSGHREAAHSLPELENKRVLAICQTVECGLPHPKVFLHNDLDRR